MAASNTRFTQNSLGQSKTPIDSDHGIYRYCEGRFEMKLPRRRFLHLAAGAVALPSVSRIAHRQTYPARPITMVVPLAPGGSTDVIGRIMAEAMRGPLGQPVIVENTAGAGGTIGVGRVARASPDGYTVLIGQWGTNVAKRCNLSAPVRPVEGFRADRADRDAAEPDRCAQDHASKRPEGIDRLVEGQRGQGHAGELRHRDAQPRRRHSVPEFYRRPRSARALPQRWTDHAGLARRRHRYRA